MTEPTEGERLARLEVLLETLAREISGLRAGIRGLRRSLNTLMFVMVAMWVMVIITILLRM